MPSTRPNNKLLREPEVLPSTATKPKPRAHPRSKQACTKCKKAKTRCLLGEGKACVRCVRRGEAHLCTPAIPQRIGRKRIHTSSVPISSEELKRVDSANKAKRARRRSRQKKKRPARKKVIEDDEDYVPAGSYTAPADPPQRTRSGRIVRRRQSTAHMFSSTRHLRKSSTSSVSSVSSISSDDVPIVSRRVSIPKPASRHSSEIQLERISPVASPVLASREASPSPPPPLNRVTTYEQSPIHIEAPSHVLPDEDFSHLFANATLPPAKTFKMQNPSDYPVKIQRSHSAFGDSLLQPPKREAFPMRFDVFGDSTSSNPHKFRPTPACNNIFCNHKTCSNGKLDTLDSLRFSDNSTFMLEDVTPLASPQEDLFFRLPGDDLFAPEEKETLPANSPSTQKRNLLAMSDMTW